MSRAVEGDRPTRFGSSGAEGPLPLSSIVMAPRRRLSLPMSLFLDIGEGAGLAGSTGVRPFLPPLLAGALARGDHGIDFSGSKYHFLESTWFLLLVLVLAVIAYALERREGPPEQTAAVAGRAAGSTRACASCGSGRQEARPRRNRRPQARDARAGRRARPRAGAGHAHEARHLRARVRVELPVRHPRGSREHCHRARP